MAPPLLAVLVTAPVLLSGGAGAAEPEEPLSVVIYMTDDQRADTLWVMEQVQERLVARGVLFERAYVATPLCCPTRASLTAGGFQAQDTHVLSNVLPNGSADRFDDAPAMPRRLQDAGYRTGFMGKYLQGHPLDTVPPGWDRWVRPRWTEDWFSYTVLTGASEGEATASTAAHVDQYITDYLGGQAVAFIEAAGTDPFFLWVNTFAPHYPHTPAAEDAGAYDGETWRGGAFDEAVVSDKPLWVRHLPRIDDATMATMDARYADYLESLVAVDRSVGAILDALEAADRLDDTVFVFTSDNGLLWGEHRYYDKGVAYEESVRVPLVVLAPGAGAGTDTHLVSITTDLAATVLDLVGVEGGTDGASLAPLLWEEDPDWRSALLLEGYAQQAVPDWGAIVTETWKYVEYNDGSVELYNLEADPAELTSRHTSAFLAGVRADLDRLLEAEKGLTVSTRSVQLRRGVEAAVEMSAWGGTPPLRWSISSGTLPDGLSLGEDGVLSGTPTVVGTRAIQLSVEDSSTSPYDGGTQVYTRSLQVRVVE